jgi:hypothetical protein
VLTERDIAMQRRVRLAAGGVAVAAAVLWMENRDSDVPHVPSPLVHDGRLSVVHGRLVIRTTLELVAFDVAAKR